MAVIRKIKSKGNFILPDGNVIYNPNDFSIKVILLSENEAKTNAESIVTIPEGKKDDNKSTK